jgi:hypothetical protein
VVGGILPRELELWRPIIHLSKKALVTLKAPRIALFCAEDRWSDITFELREMIVFRRNDHSRPSQKNGDFSRRKE